MSQTDLERFTAACDYPGTLNQAAVETHLAAYLKALGIDRKIQRIDPGWVVADYPDLEIYVNRVLDDFAKRVGYKRDALAALDAFAARAARAALDAFAARDARAARAALDALDALDARVARAARDARAALAARDALDALDALDGAIERFAKWCIQADGWSWWRFDISWISTTILGAKQLGIQDKVPWAQPLFEAYIAGAWMLHFTEETVYWVAKPTVHTELANGVKRLHNSTYAALESDVENLYFWHGVLVPAFVVVRPDWITLDHISSENNAEVRRVMIERYGQQKYITDSGAALVHEDECGKLYRKDLDDDEPLIMVRVLNPTPEADGSLSEAEARATFGDLVVDQNLTTMARIGFAAKLEKPRFKEYFLRVPPDIETAREAVAWTFNVAPENYIPSVQT